MSEVKHPGFPAYTVTDDGRVFSIHYNWRGYGRREMRQSLNASGYPSVRLVVLGGKRKRVPVHRLVAECHIGECPRGCDQVRHLNGDKTDNRASNLRWGTAAENAADREAHGNTSRGESHSVAIRRGIAASENPYWRHAQ